MSGGPDSLALLIAASQLAGDRPVRAATVDHALRPGSDREAARVADWCSELAIPHRTLVWRHPDRPLRNLQAEARAARYALLAAEARRCGAGVVLTAHHRHDQAETHLLLRARGARGGALAAMRVWRDLEPGVVVVRPFLGRVPADLALWPADAGWQPILDPSNLDGRFARVRLRSAMSDDERAAALAAAADAARLREADDRNLADQLGTLSEAGRLNVDLDASIGMPDDWHGLGDRVLARAITVAGGALHSPSPDALDRLRHAVAQQGRATLNGCVADVRRGRLRLSREFGRTGLPQAVAGDDGLAIFDRRFVVGPLPGQSVVEGDGANVKARTHPAVRDPMGELRPLRLAAGPLPRGSAPEAACCAGWRLWADLPGPMPVGLTPQPQIAANGTLAVGKV
ncbi:tRNA lysidine(34) synthetase TilS [Aureimonas jatrophae]|uniref:tRNA lysidine(34) synthetase TilS n=1 Tax=Aureimonas jatrophae TaxID=1166073 RepID=UPI00147A15AE|nr:tRNA lysidine(34) synthetase TilS [Aureimonas jatrophae]MBB3949254.1 tRNA(Ile)-lysidine synthase [Aureimonas jatrophae]